MTDPAAMSASADDPRAVIVVFLRGGADGLSLVPPVGDDGYHRARPRIAIPAQGSLRLDGMFSLHPDLSALERWYRDGHLAVVHAAGSNDATRSHFEAQDLMEHAGQAMAGGWFGRWLRAERDPSAGRPASALAAIAIGTAMPESLRGSPSTTVMRSFADLDLGSDTAWMRDPIASLYDGDAMLGDSAGSALRGLDAIAA
ncbi:MAG: hypothetical protein H0W83_16150, partial [Planctomycetes bacterium]|nr:hypothetical protein [Planctomycetota bacterium]